MWWLTKPASTVPQPLRLLLLICVIVMAYCLAGFLPRTQSEEEWNGDGLGPAGRLELMLQHESEDPRNAIEHSIEALDASSQA
jgi:hypothetical protein